MESFYHQPARDIPVMRDFDVIVAGGGPAGCAAARYAAKSGARVLVVEKAGYLGGATVSQLVLPVLSTNGVDFQGVWHEYAAALQRIGGMTQMGRERKYNANWYVAMLEAEAVKYVWNILLTEVDAEILHHAYITDAIVENGCIRGVVVETPGGRKAVTGKIVIDATGDGTVCDRAGVPWEMGADGKPWAMGVSKNALVGGIPEPAYKRLAGQAAKSLGRILPNRNEALMGIKEFLRIDPLDEWAISEVERKGMERQWEKMAELKKIPGYEKTYLAQSSEHCGVRSSRRIRGLNTVTDDDCMYLRKSAESIARSSWEVDIHPAEREISDVSDCCDYKNEEYGKRVERINAGDYFDIPYGCIVAKGVDNLLAAGRCISSGHKAQASLRIQQTCMSLGQAAGTAAVLSISNGVTPRELAAAGLVERLQKDRAEVAPAFEM